VEERREHELFRIREAARVCRLHPQTLRLYERAGLLRPVRSRGNARLYSRADIERLSSILVLTRDMRVNLAGVEIILRLRQRVAELEREVARLSGSPDSEPVAIEHAPSRPASA
jgi:MerR family transcriptional regulator/heat shock protein HspR